MAAKVWAVAGCFVALALAFVAIATPVPIASAYELFPSGASEFNDDSLTIGAGNSAAKNIINMALVVLGGVALIMVVVGGIRISAAHGDPSQVKAGRETVLYSLVGLIVAMSAYAIINFVVSFNW